MKIVKTHGGSLTGVAALVLASVGGVRADIVPLSSAPVNPFEMSRFQANSPSDDSEKEPVPAKSDIPEPGDGHLLSDFVYYNSLQTQGGVSLFGGGGGSGFAGSGGVTGLGGGVTGEWTRTGPSGGGEGYDEDSIPQNPAPGAVVLGMMGLSMTGWVRRRWAR